MSKCWFRRILLVSGFLAFPAALVPWLLGVFMILAAGSGESVSVRQTGMVTCPELLQWTPWTDGAEDVRHGDFTFRINEDSAIVGHRVGTCKNSLPR